MRLKLSCFIFLILLYLSLQVLFIYYSDSPASLKENSNLIHLSISEPFHYDQHNATKFIFKKLLEDNQDINSNQCSFPNPQFTEKESEIIFKYKTYPKCKTTTKLEISLYNNTLKVRCPNKLKPRFIHDTATRQTLGGRIKPKSKWTLSAKINSNSEYIIISCGKKSTYAYAFLRFQGKLSQKANKKREDLGWNEKNFNVFILLFDQISRYSALRNWPKTINFLNHFSENSNFNSSISLYEFEKTPSVKPYTLDNIVPLLYGKTYKEMASKVGSKRLAPFEYSKRHLFYQYKYSIWKFYSNLGYTTMFLHDSVYDFLSKILGRDIAADHSFLNFWRAALGVYGWSDFDDKQRCLGDKDSHELSLEYLYQYAETYKDNNKFSYVHLDAAHEDSGNVKTVDKDLGPFFDRFFRLMQQRNESFVFFLLSDHGIKYMNDNMWDIRTFYESVDPMMYVFVSKDVEEKWKMKEILKHNTKAVVSRFDINLSFKDLAYYPYNLNRETYYDHYKTQYSIEGVSSIFSEKISYLRTCNDILVKPEYCLCKKPVDIDSYTIKFDTLKSYFRQLVIKYFDLQSKRETDCKALNDFEIESGKMFKLEENRLGGDTIYYFVLISEDLTIEVMARFCSQDKIEISGQILDEKVFPYLYFVVERRVFFLQIASVDLIGAKCKKNCVC